MSYQVLARKWRPRNFSSLVGQEHVVRALSHALDEQRLHHAWLFTGTRGVGKTTLARILAKCLNCASGVTATPCGECQACVEIDEGRFVDYIELDAASNRRVEEMTQLLEQAVYAPGAGRYKVYTIDEVHMLTGHAFNAMLKTLEEPPAHVKFILATTDPQKIPATVLSRCLQFNLKPIAPPVIAEHLQQVLLKENIAFEPQALLALGQAAAGSMRDALSLTDQAIAFSGADIQLQAVQSMLGGIDGNYLVRLMQGLQEQDAQQLLQTADELHQHGLSFGQTLADWAELLSTVALAQRAPDFVDYSVAYSEHIAQWADSFSPDALQLFYTVAIHSRNELHLAPTEYTGFVMACLRMLTLVPTEDVRPAGTGTGSETAKSKDVELQAAEPTASKPTASDTEAEEPEASESKASDTEAEEPEASELKASEPEAEEPITTESKTIESVSKDPSVAALDSAKEIAPPKEKPSSPEEELSPPQERRSPPQENLSPPQEEFSPPQEELPPWVDTPTTEIQSESTRLLPEQMDAAQWARLAAELPLTGWAAQIAKRSEWVCYEQGEVVLRLELRSVDDMQAKTRLNTVLNEYFGQPLRLTIEYGRTGDETADAIYQAKLREQQERAEQAVAEDPFIHQLKEQFGAELIKGSILPRTHLSS